MENQKAQMLATITERFTKQKIACNNAQLAIRDARLETFTDFLPNDDKVILLRAENILSNISNNSSVLDALKYFNNHT